MNNPIRFVDVDGMYSTEEWKKDNGVTDDMLTTIYQAPDSNDSSDGDKDKSKKDDSKSRGNEASKSPLAIIPAVGPALVSGQYLDEGEYLEAAIWEAYAFADLFTLGYASKFKLAEKAAKTGINIADDVFVHVTTPGGASNILSKGLNPEISGYVTKWKYVKNVTNPSDFNTMLYSQKLWPQTVGRFNNGFNILRIDANPTFFGPRTNWVNGIPQYRFYDIIPPSKISLIK